MWALHVAVEFNISFKSANTAVGGVLSGGANATFITYVAGDKSDIKKAEADNGLLTFDFLF